MVRTLQVTIGAGKTPILPSGEIIAQWVIFQNNAAHAMRIGDSNITTTLSTSPGIQLQASGSSNPPPSAPTSKTRLSFWFVTGTQNDVLDVIYDDGL